jgi:ribose transport system substrate-binding protein
MKGFRARLRTVVIVSLLGAFCSTALAQQQEHKIGFSNWSKRFVFYQDLERGLKGAAEENDVELFVGDPNGDQAAQQSLVENFLTRGIDGLILIPIDSRAVTPTVETANRAGVPVVTVDISAEGGDVVTHIASDNCMGGRLAAERMNEVLSGEGEVALITYPVISATIEREECFVEAIADYPGIEVVARQSGESDRNQALSLTEDLLLRNPGLAGIFAVNDMMGLGALAAVEAANKQEQISIIGFDAQPEAVEAMRSGSVYKGSVAQQSELLGEMALEMMLKHLNGEEVPDNIPVEVKMVTPGDLE